MLSTILVRLKALLFRRASDAELDQELQYHLDREVERNVALGMSPRAAREAARRAFGNPTVAAELSRDASRWRSVEELRQDLIFAARTFKRAPLFVLTVVLTIGVGLGLLSTAFTFFNAYVLRPFEVRDPYSLFDAAWTSRNGRAHGFTWEQYGHLKEQRAVFSDIVAHARLRARLHGRQATGQLVTGNLFQMLGVPAALGRTLLPSDTDAPGGNAVVVLSHQAWKTNFGGDSSVVGTRVNILGTSFTIVGVAREGFGGLTSAAFDFWIPITMIGAVGPTPGLFGDAKPEGVVLTLHLAPCVRPGRATSALLELMRRETSDRPAIERATDVVLIDRSTSMPQTPDTVAVFAPVIVAFLLVMLIACANVANIMLARGMARQREIGIRLALGAGRGRLIRQLLTEAVLLALPSGIIAFLVSRGAVWLSTTLIFATVPKAYVEYIHIIPLDADGRVFAFMMIAALGAAVMFGLMPALQATRPNIVQASRGDFDTQFRPSRMRNALVIAQVTLSVLLLITAGVLLSSAQRTAKLDPGVRTKNVLQLVLLPRVRDKALDVLRRDRNVLSIASSSSTALEGTFKEVMVSPSGGPAQRVSYNVVSHDYFAVLDLPILIGRGFTEDEARSRAPVAIVSQSTAEHLWPGKNPIGQTLSIPPTDRDFALLEPYHATRVIGVTRDASPGVLVKGPTTPTVYFPLPLDANVNQVIARVGGASDRAQATLEQTLAAVDSATVVEIHSLEESVSLQVYPFQAMYWVASVVGGIALLLTLTGVYGVLSYVVAQRRREFGIRLALGAGDSRLIGLIMRQSLGLAIKGIVIGVPLALGVSRIFASVLFNLDTYDVSGYAIGVGIVLVTCLGAAYAPSRRAASVNPVETLRADS